MAWTLLRMAAARVQTWGLALAGDGVDHVERLGGRLVAGQAEAPIVGEQADLVDRLEAREAGGQAVEQAGA
jgi:hypothetical protein